MSIHDYIDKQMNAPEKPTTGNAGNRARFHDALGAHSLPLPVVYGSLLASVHIGFHNHNTNSSSARPNIINEDPSDDVISHECTVLAVYPAQNHRPTVAGRATRNEATRSNNILTNTTPVRPHRACLTRTSTVQHASLHPFPGYGK